MIPAQVNEITADWLNDRLGDDIGTISSVSVEHVGEGVGILGEIARLTLTYVEGQTGPATLIAKCQSLFPENIGLCQMMGFYEREINFYNQVADSVSIDVPRCHVADMAEGGAPFVLIMDEITDARMIDQLEGATLDDAKLVAQTVASLHAAFWASESLDELAWLPPMNNDMYKGAQMLVEANMPGFVEAWSGRVPANAIEWCQQILPVYPAMLDWWPENSPSTFTHTDCRAENYLFGGSAGDGAVTVLDFQLSTRHVGTWDIANFLGMSVTIENRRAWERDVIEHYHRTLVAAGVTDYDLDQCWRDFRYCLLHQAFAQVATVNLDPGNDRGRALLNEFITRSFQAASDHNAGDMLSEL